MMDLSDGLHKDLKRLCAASHCGARVFPYLIPGVSRMDWRVSFGEDYELLFAASPEQQDAIVSLTAMQGVSATRIGVLTAALSVELVGQPWPDLLFDHFPGGLS
jgi:thiamine-monophosphate kinase